MKDSFISLVRKAISTSLSITNSFRDSIGTSIYSTGIMQTLLQKKMKRNIKRIKNKNTITVLFLISDLSQWKLSELYSDLEKQTKFQVYVGLNGEKKLNSSILTKLQKLYFSLVSKQYNVIKNIDFSRRIWIKVGQKIRFDVVFFDRLTDRSGFAYTIDDFPGALSCYLPYSFFTDNNDTLQLGTLAHKKVWRQFLPTSFHLEKAEEINKNSRALLTGYPKSSCIHNKVIKVESDRKVRLIWAPHHTIEEKDGNYFSTFKKYAFFFREIQDKYSDELKICFKPHPALYEKLLFEKDWGEKKTIEYYRYWKNRQSLFLEDYGNLFEVSDAMVLDSVSFLAEYLFTNKPYCFLLRDSENECKNKLNEVGKEIYSVIYKASDTKEIEKFIIDTLFNKVDPLKERREDVLGEFCKINAIKCPHEIIVDHLIGNLLT